MKKVSYSLLILFTLIFCIALCSCNNNASPTEHLDAPQNLHIEGRTLVWDKVKNAEGCIIVKPRRCLLPSGLFSSSSSGGVGFGVEVYFNI